ncbi:hypothetical protein, partial [Limnospira sp. PMC 1298.21]
MFRISPCSSALFVQAACSRKTPGRVGSSVIDHGEENRLKRLTAASTPLRGGGVWLPLHGAMVGSD